MQDQTQSLIAQEVRALLNLLVEGELEIVDSITEGSRVKAADVDAAIRRYGRTLVPPPADLIPWIDAVVCGKGLQQVNVPLWTAEEGRSDLELRLTAHEVMEGIWELRVDDVLVP